MDLIQLVKSFVTTWFNEHLHGLLLGFFFYQANNIFGWMGGLSCWNYSCCFYYHLIFIYCIYLFYLFISFLLLVGWLCGVLMPLSTNISVKSWRSVLLVKETGGQGENHLISYVRRLEV
jgi:hypothetical protein